jgi:hypothetical protein
MHEKVKPPIQEVLLIEGAKRWSFRNWPSINTQELGKTSNTSNGFAITIKGIKNGGCGLLQKNV